MSLRRRITVSVFALGAFALAAFASYHAYTNRLRLFVIPARFRDVRELGRWGTKNELFGDLVAAERNGDAKARESERQRFCAAVTEIVRLQEPEFPVSRLCRIDRFHSIEGDVFYLACFRLSRPVLATLPIGPRSIELSESQDSHRLLDSRGRLVDPRKFVHAESPRSKFLLQCDSSLGHQTHNWEELSALCISISPEEQVVSGLPVLATIDRTGFVELGPVAWDEYSTPRYSPPKKPSPLTGAKRERVKDLLASPSTGGVLRALQLLADSGCELESARTSLDHRSPLVRARALSILGREHATWEEIERLSSDSEPRVRLTAVEILGARPGPAADRVAQSRTTDEDRAIRIAAHSHLAARGRSAEIARASLLYLLDKRVESWAILAADLERLSSPEIVRAALDWAEDELTKRPNRRPYRQLVMFARSAFWRLKREHVAGETGRVVALLDEVEPSVREGLLVALAEIGSTEAAIATSRWTVEEGVWDRRLGHRFSRSVLPEFLLALASRPRGDHSDALVRKLEKWADFAEDSETRRIRVGIGAAAVLLAWDVSGARQRMIDLFSTNFELFSPVEIFQLLAQDDLVCEVLENAASGDARPGNFRAIAGLIAEHLVRAKAAPVSECVRSYLNVLADEDPFSLGAYRALLSLAMDGRKSAEKRLTRMLVEPHPDAVGTRENAFPRELFHSRRREAGPILLGVLRDLLDAKPTRDENLARHRIELLEECLSSLVALWPEEPPEEAIALARRASRRTPNESQLWGFGTLTLWQVPDAIDNLRSVLRREGLPEEMLATWIDSFDQAAAFAFGDRARRRDYRERLESLVEEN